MRRNGKSSIAGMLTLLVLPSAVLAACGGDDDDTSEAGSSEAGATAATLSDVEGDWQLKSYAVGDPGNDDQTAVSADAPATASFTADAVSGKTGCNNFNGPFDLDDGKITVGPLATTRMACPDVQAQEQAVLAGFDRARRAVIEDGALQLLDGAGNPVLFFEPATS